MKLFHSFLGSLFLFQVAAVLANRNVTGVTNATNTNLPIGPITTDSMCGPKHNNTICVLDGIAPCCSEQGFCGGDYRYCTTGCHPSFGLCHEPNSSTLDNLSCSRARQGDSPRCDGQCGADHNGALCDTVAPADAFVSYGVFNYVSCCSEDGLRGNTSARCGKEIGCQSGCWGGDEGATSSSSAVSTVTVTVSASAATTSTGAAVRSRATEGVLVLRLGVLGMIVAIRKTD